MKILYYDCFAGISGDMNLGAMIDLGVDPEYLRAELRKIAIGSYEFRVRREVAAGHFRHEARCDSPLGKGSCGTRPRAPVVQGYPQAHRERRPFPMGSKARALIFSEKLLPAEAKIHGHAIDEVEFHEVGAIDSIVDVVGAAICFESLRVDRILSSPVQVGGDL